MWWWAIGGWLGCSAVVVVGERIMARHGAGVLERGEQFATSAAAYALIVLFAPAMLATILAMAILAGPLQVLRLIRGQPIDPFRRPEKEWLRQDPGGFAHDLVRRRQVKDPRLKGVDFGKWMPWQTSATADAMILDVVSKYRALKAAGVDDASIWSRIEAHRFDKGEGHIPSPCDLAAYVDYRLGLEDPGYLDIGVNFVREQIAFCERYVLHRAREREDREWPPQAWLRQQIDLLQFERWGSGIDPMAEGAPAALTLGGGRVRKDLLDLKFLMLPGDEIWTFSSPQEYWAGLAGRAGIVLLRAGRPVSHVVTSMN